MSGQLGGDIKAAVAAIAVAVVLAAIPKNEAHLRERGPMNLQEQ
jgi:hypothetical protein